MSIDYDIPHVVNLGQTMDIEYGERYYGTILGGDVYFSKRLRTEDWTTNSEENKQKALFEATFMVDRLNFKGKKTSASQQLQFPRDGASRVPRDIEYAIYEVAILLLNGLDPDAENRTLENYSTQFGSMKTQQHLYRNPLPYVVAGIYSSKAWRFLFPYIRDSQTISLKRQ